MSSVDLSPEQKAAAFFPLGLDDPRDRGRKNLVIEAGAGAGKTRVLTDRVQWLLFNSPKAFRLAAQDLVLVTFSKAADEELRQRVEKEIKKAPVSSEVQQRILSRLHISTIDSLFMQLVGNLFPSWWEQTKNKLSDDTLKSWGLTDQRFPPAVTLVSESELFPELAEEILRILEQNCQSPDSEIQVLDFILAGAFQSQRAFGGSKVVQIRHRGLERIASAMLHENFLSDSAPPLRFALERIHPSSEAIIALIQSKARELFRKRLMHGRVTHNDRALFLYQLLCLPPEQRRIGFFDLAEIQTLPMSCAELIVDEYQDTNQIQHDILSTLVRQPNGRMVVVGDPKQSIYGFRSAHVGVFQKLKSDPQWKLIELTRNYRSHPDLLPFINLLSDITFSYRNNRIPEGFRNTAFALMAQQTFVKAKALDAGRNQQSEAQPEQRLLLLGASLNKDRAEDDSLLKRVKPNTFAAWALARELQRFAQVDEAPLQSTASLQNTLHEDNETERKRYSWSEIAVLCETNDHVAETHRALVSFGIPAVAKLSRAPEQSLGRKKTSEELGLLLAKWLCKPLDARELASFLWSGWLSLSREDTSVLLKACAEGQLDATLVVSSISGTNTQKSYPLPDVWIGWVSHVLHCRSLARRNFFSAWQVLRWGYVAPAHNLAMENTALVLHQTLEVWSLRRQLEEGSGWPEEFLHTQLNQIRLSQNQTDTTQNALTVCTIHAAKGLEWPVVVFWPNSARERTPENFVMKSGDGATYIKWLAEDKESASLIPWINNPTPPADQVAIYSESDRGEKIVRWSADLQDKLEQDFERQRVFYTAFTRAREMLIIMSPSLQGRARSNLRDKLAPLKKGDPFDPQSLKLNGLEYNALGLFADSVFDLRKEAKRGARPPEPWTTQQTDAICLNSEWFGLVRMRDYGPAWLSEDPRLFSDPEEAPAEVTSENEVENLAWIQPWLESQHQKAQQTPWQNTDKESAAPLNLPSEEPTEKTSTGSAAESGLRFHALMEHADANHLRDRKFLYELLSKAKTRLHELEIWSAAEVDQSPSQVKRHLLSTQRRIIDLFCVVDADSLPKVFQKSACLRFTSQETPEQSPTFAVVDLKTCLKQTLDLHPHLHMVVDFKTGSPSPDHLTQMHRYLRWTREVLDQHPEQLVGDLDSSTLFSGQKKPLVGVIYYSATSPLQHSQESTLPLVPIDKSSSLLFVYAD